MVLRRERADGIRSIVSSTVLGFVLVIASRAEAATPDVKLAWKAPPGCPNRPRVIERIGQIRGSNAAETSNVEAVAVVEKKNVYELVITTRRGDAVQTRTASSASCASLVEAAAIIVAVALDEASADHEVELDRAPAPTAAPAPELAPHEPEPPGPPPKAPRDEPVRPPSRAVKGAPVTFGLGAAGLFDVGMLPNPTFGAQLHAALTFGRVQLGLAGSIWAEGEQRPSNGQRAGVRFDVFDAGAFACWSPLGGRLRIGGCVETDITVMKLEGFGMRQPGSARVLWPTVRVGPMAELAVDRALVFFGRVDASFAIAVPRVVLTTESDNVPLYEVSVPSLRLTLGLRANVL